MLNPGNQPNSQAGLAKVLLKEQNYLTGSNAPAISIEHPLVQATLSAFQGRPGPLRRELEGLKARQVDRYTDWIDRLAQNLSFVSNANLMQTIAGAYLEGLNALGIKLLPGFAANPGKELPVMPFELLGALGRYAYRFSEQGICPQLTQHLWQEFMEVEKAAALLTGRPLRDYELWQHLDELRTQGYRAMTARFAEQGTAALPACQEGMVSPHRLFSALIMDKLHQGAYHFCEFELTKYLAVRAVLEKGDAPMQGLQDLESFIRLKPFLAPYPSTVTGRTYDRTTETGCLYSLQSLVRAALEDNAPTAETADNARALIAALTKLPGYLSARVKNRFCPTKADYELLARRPQTFIGAGLAFGRA